MLRASSLFLSRLPRRASLALAHSQYVHSAARQPNLLPKSEADVEPFAVRKQEAELRKAEAEARTAEFEADVAKIRAAAEAAKAEAEAAAAAQRVKAEVDAAKARAAAEAATAEAEVVAAVDVAKAEAEAEVARARKAEAKPETDAAVSDVSARKSASETFHGTLAGRTSAAVAIAAIVTSLGLLVAFALSRLRESAQAADQAEAVRRFERRRIDAIKERICSRLPSAAAAASVESYRFPRPEALKALECMSTKAGLYMVIGPKGEGKTALVSQFVSSHPHVIYVNLQGGSMDSAVRAVAAALGYDMAYSMEEASACKRGCMLPDCPRSILTCTTLCSRHSRVRAWSYALSAS